MKRGDVVNAFNRVIGALMLVIGLLIVVGIVTARDSREQITGSPVGIIVLLAVMVLGALMMLGRFAHVASEGSRNVAGVARWVGVLMRVVYTLMFLSALLAGKRGWVAGAVGMAIIGEWQLRRWSRRVSRGPS